MGRCGKSRGRASGESTESAASLSTETEIATAASRPGKAKEAKGIQDSEAEISAGGEWEAQQEKATAAVVTAAPAAAQHELGH